MRISKNCISTQGRGSGFGGISPPLIKKIPPGGVYALFAQYGTNKTDYNSFLFPSFDYIVYASACGPGTIPKNRVSIALVMA